MQSGMNRIHLAHTAAADNGADNWCESDIYIDLTFGWGLE